MADQQENKRRRQFWRKTGRLRPFSKTVFYHLIGNVNYLALSQFIKPNFVTLSNTLGEIMTEV
jgi:hypothetical protein